MKTVFNKIRNKFKRVKEDEAELLVQSNGWVYVPKSEYKKLQKIEPEEKEISPVKEKKKKSKK